MKTTPSTTSRLPQLLGRLTPLRRHAVRTVVLRSRRIGAGGNGEGGSQSGQEKQFAGHRRSLLDQGSGAIHQFLVPILASPKGQKMCILLHSLQRLCHFQPSNASFWSPRTSRRLFAAVIHLGKRHASRLSHPIPSSFRSLNRCLAKT